jgi:hypothetical protein
MKNQEQVQEVINDVINDKITQMVEEMSTNEFVDMMCDKIYTEKGIEYTDDQRDEIGEMIGNKMFPLIHKISEYLIGQDIPIK